jgi:transcriptional regulator with XRE-family HTH domain
LASDRRGVAVIIVVMPDSQSRRSMTAETDRLVGRALRRIRLARGISIQAAADHFGVSFQLLSRVERGKVRLHAGDLHRMAVFFEAPIAAFYDEVSEGGGHPNLTDEERQRAPDVSLAFMRAVFQIRDEAALTALLAVSRALAEASAAASRGDCANVDRPDSI